jgi:hypothetical protein
MTTTLEILYTIAGSIIAILLATYIFRVLAHSSHDVLQSLKEQEAEDDAFIHALKDSTNMLPSQRAPETDEYPQCEMLPDGTTPLNAPSSAPSHAKMNIPQSEESRGQTNPFGMTGMDEYSGQTAEPIQMLNPIPNDRLMPLSGAKDDPITTRLDSMEHMGLYKLVLEKDMGQSSSSANKNRFFEFNGPRESPYHLYGAADSNAFDNQQRFSGGSVKTDDQPKHRNFDLGFEINYRKLDQENATNKQKINTNLLIPFAS